jgi:hypothetical protein
MPISFSFVRKDGKRLPFKEVCNCAANAVRSIEKEPSLNETNETSHDRVIYSILENMAIAHTGKSIKEICDHFSDDHILHAIVTSLKSVLNVDRFESFHYD